LSEGFDAGQRVEVLTSAPFSLADAMALKAMFAGEATPDQQKAGMLWITRIAGRLNKMSYQPGAVDDTSFLEGRRFVGNLIMRLVTTNPDELRSEIEQQKRKRPRHG
jgi:hypothetical protein